MSGIAGFFSSGSRSIQSETWDRMVSLARERGRETQLTWSHPAHPADFSQHKVALAQTWAKLADGRNSPRAIASDDGSIVVALDGVIYNTEELRELENVAPGRRLSNGQLIALAYQEWGPDFVTRLNGDFAIAIYDRKQELLFCARDRMGVRPFYYAQLDEAIVFGSEIKIVLAHPDLRRDPDWQSLYYYAASPYRYFDSRPDRTCFRAVNQLPQATCLLATSSGVKTWRYWSLDPEAETTGSPDQASARLLELLDDSVRLRVETSNQPGFTLGGGIDSASVLSLGCRYLQTPAEVYTAGYDTAVDQTSHVRQTVEALEGKWHAVGVSGPSLEASVTALLRRHDEPVSTVNWLSHYLLSRQASFGGVRVLFGGLGGDELMAGHQEHLPYFLADLQQAGLGERLDREIACWKTLHGRPPWKDGDRVEDVLARLVNWKPPGTVKIDMKRYSAYESAMQPNIREQFGRPPQFENPFSSYLKNRCYQDLFFETIPSCLRADDRNVSTFGMRSCYPLLDYRVVEFGFAVPSAFKYQDGVTKQVLRKAMQGIVPEISRLRTAKIGRKAPSGEWFRNQWEGYVSDLIRADSFRQRGVYDARRVHVLFDEHRTGKADHENFLWQVVNIELWFRHWTA